MGFHAAVIPVDCQRGQVAPFGELPCYHVCVTLTFGCGDELEEALVFCRSVTIDGVGCAELEFLEVDVERVTCHVADGARAEIPPWSPVAGMICRVVRAVGGRSEPEVPVHPGRG